LEEDGVLKTLALRDVQKARLAPFDEEKTPKPKHAVGASAPATQSANVEKSVG
jgi:ribosome maturation factor RimP